MTESKTLLSRPYQELYSDYYAKNGLLKRELSASQSVACMARALENATTDKLLDVGAGEGSVLLQLGRRGLAHELHAMEISESGVATIKSRNIPRLSKVQLFDGYTIPYPDKYFDLSIAIHVLEHVEHERLFLREIGRVSRRAYIEVPLEHGFRIQRSIVSGRKYGHINFYTRETLCNLLQSSSFEVVRSEVFPSSAAYEECISGRFKGRLKNLARRCALAAAPRLAPWFIAYNGYALCECK